MGSVWILGFYFLLATASSTDVFQENSFTDLSGIHLNLYHVKSNSSLFNSKSWLHDVLARDEERFKAFSSRLAQNEAEITTSASSSSHSKRTTDLKSVSLPLNSGISIRSGNYYVKIGLGSPAKYYPVIMDTGSSFSWLQCQPCRIYCHNQAGPIFDPSASKTYKSLPCDRSECSSLKRATLNDPFCEANSHTCIYTASYGDASFSIGYLSQDRLTLNPSQVLPSFVYGCGQDNQGLFGMAAGIIGLARDKLSLLAQTSYKYGYGFSYCLPSAKGGQGGVLSIGTASLGTLSSFKFTPMVTDPRNPSLYFIGLSGITVAGKPLGVSAATYKVPTIIDSGTVITRLPTPVYSTLKDTFVKIMKRKYTKASGYSILDTCFKGSLASVTAVPPIQLVFQGGAALNLAPKNILIEIEDLVCLAFTGSKELAIIGNHQQQTFKVAYDVSKSRIGFAPGGCR